jgi:ferric-dicitrate binding protein FerR (iron transport regulator)
MKNSIIKDLLNRLTSGKITPTDFRLLKENISYSSDEELDQEIKVLWDEFKITPMDRNTKETVLSDIHRQMKLTPKRSIRYWTGIAAVILLPLLISFASYYYFSNKYTPVVPQEFIIMAENGQKTKVLLPDGTQVWLNSKSQLVYSSDFNRNNRKVKLEGEAFFDVNKSTDQRFVVETSSVNVVVYGTAFNVAAYQDEETIDISLLRGKIGIENRIDNRTLTEILPNQLISVSKKDMQWSVRDHDARIESLWTQNKLKFENTPAAEVFHKLERWYGINIYVENPNEETRYGFTLKSESLREMLKKINKITPIDYKINGEEVIIKYK